MKNLYTIGHSTHPLDTFIDILADAGIQHLIDIRTVPRSRTNPQFNQDTLPAPLQMANIDYTHLAALGGLRSKSKTADPATNAFWQNASFHRYADYALSPAFGEGLQALITFAQDQTCAIMCAEAVWWRCHRRIVSDYLLARDIPVFHIMGPGQIKAAELTSGARIQSDLSVQYPPLD